MSIVFTFFVAIFIVYIAKEQLKATKRKVLIHSGLHKNTIWGKRMLTEDEREILQSHFPYYRGLDQTRKKAFESRVKHFQPSVNFIAMKDCHVNTETPILISATIVMMTFGLNQFRLPLFSDILIFENVYYNATSKAHHKGETDASGRLVFSQHHILEGYLDYTDNLNLAIHEFAHAMHFQVFRNSADADLHFSREIYNWTNWIGTNANRRLITESNYFRKYAQTNTFELFAVATECFFETPSKFQEELPGLFLVMVNLFNQNPLNIYENLK